MSAPDFDPARILRTLHGHDVRFVLIGGLAVIAHGHLRATADVDVVPDPDRSNLERLASALAALEARIAGVDADLLGIDLAGATLAGGANFTLTTRFGALDVMQDVPGLADYGALAAAAVPTSLDDVPVLVVGLADLLRLKEAADRPQDREDVRALRELGVA
jgi:hypothetical protein